MELGDRIRELRTKNRLSQGDLARAIKSATSTISEIERGERKPRTELLLKIGDYFDVSVDFLLGRVPEDRVREITELLAEVDTIKKDFEDMSSELSGGLRRLSKIPPPPEEIPIELLGEIPEIIDEATRARLEAEFDLRIRTSRLEDKYINQLFRFLLVIEKMKEGDGLPEKNEERGDDER